jgi:hypothetical protein
MSATLASDHAGLQPVAQPLLVSTGLGLHLVTYYDWVFTPYMLQIWSRGGFLFLRTQFSSELFWGRGLRFIMKIAIPGKPSMKRRSRCCRSLLDETAVPAGQSHRRIPPRAPELPLLNCPPPSPPSPGPICWRATASCSVAATARCSTPSPQCRALEIGTQHQYRLAWPATIPCPRILLQPLMPSSKGTVRARRPQPDLQTLDPDIAWQPNFGSTSSASSKRDTSSMIVVHTYIDGEYLNSWADGLPMWPRPLARRLPSLSCGPVMPQTNTAVPRCSHTRNVRPLIVPDRS